MYMCVNVYVHECTCNQLKAAAHCLHSNMGYTDGKSESDVLIEEGDCSVIRSWVHFLECLFITYIHLYTLST